MSSRSRVQPWLLALACSWIAFCNTGVYRSSSVLYVELIRVLGVSRETASWPFSLFGAVSAFTGILPGLLSNQFTVHQFVMVGAFLSTLGVFLCYFARNATLVTFSFGVMSGFGSGLIMTLLPVTLNRQFRTNRATANGIFLSGATVSLLVLPYLTEWLVEIFDLRGTLLLLSGLVMNVFVGAALARVCDAQTEIASVGQAFRVSEPSRRQDEQQLARERTETVAFLDDSCEDVQVEMLDTTRDGLPVDGVDGRTVSERTISCFLDERYEDIQLERLPVEGLPVEGLPVNSYGRMVSERASDELSSEPLIGRVECDAEEYMETASCHQEPIRNLDGQLDPPIETASPPGSNYFRNFCIPSGKWYLKLVAGFTSVLVSCWKLLCDPMFIVITFCSVTTRTVVVTFTLVLVDYLMDKGHTEMQGVVLVSLVALPELVGRLGSGWISDRGILSRGQVFAVAEATSGLALFALTLAVSSWQRFVLSALFALTNGAAFILVNVLYLEYLGMDRLPFALGLKNLFTGLASLTRPWFIGVFRDNNSVKSYDYLFHTLAVFSVLAGLVWFIEPLFKKKSLKQNHSNRTVNS